MAIAANVNSQFRRDRLVISYAPHSIVDIEYPPLPAFRLAAQEIVPTGSTERMRWVEFLLRPEAMRSGPSVEQYIRRAYRRDGNEFDHRVIEKAFAEARALPVDTRFSVNILPTTLEDPSLLETVWSSAEESRIDLNRLILEVIEFGGAVELNSSFETIVELRRAGVGVALDDYGQGFSNLDMVSAGLVDFIKLDRSIVQGGPRTPNSRGVIEGLQAFAEATGLSLVAEGVETAEQVSAIEQFGVSWIQGFLFSRPQFLK